MLRSNKVVNLFMLVAIVTSGIGVGAEDKSATREGLIKLPSAGGTVQKEGGELNLQSNKGAANFELPLPQLPARGGLAPDLRLIYNQFQGDQGSGIGVGWSFMVPSIEMNSDKGTALRGREVDGGPFFSNLSMGGQRLKFIRQTQNGGLFYAPEKSDTPIEVHYRQERFQVSVLDKADVAQTYRFSKSFDVHYVDGTREIYTGVQGEAEGDFSQEEGHITRWPLKLKLRPVSVGIYDGIVYHYENIGGRTNLVKVSYAGGRSEIEFGYQDLGLLSGAGGKRSYQAGYRQEDRALYTRAAAKFDGHIIQQWCLVYERYEPLSDVLEVITDQDLCGEYARGDENVGVRQDTLGVLTQLRAVYRFGEDEKLTGATQRKPNVYFSYSDWNRGDLQIDGTGRSLQERKVVYGLPALAEVDEKNLPSTLADVNHDSLVDFVYRQDNQTKVRYGRGDYQESFVDKADWQLPDMASGPNFTGSKVHFADINGDSYTDVLRFDELDPSQIHVYLGDNAGNYELQSETTAICYYDAISSEEQCIKATELEGGRGQFIDLNMDGKTDFISVYRQGGQLHWRFCDPLLFEKESGQLSVWYFCNSTVFPWATTDDGILKKDEVRFADLNGDRLPDLVHLKKENGKQGYCVYANQGDIYRFGEFALFGDPEANDERCAGTGGRYHLFQGLSVGEDQRNMWFVDVNGDGIQDFAQLDKDTGAYMKIWLGMGDGSFTKTARKLDLNESLAVSEKMRQHSRLADIDSDGQSEIILLKAGSAAEGSRLRVIDFNRLDDEHQLPKSNLLTAVQFESGLRYDIKYATSVDEYLRDVSQAGYQASLNELAYLHFPAVVVKQVATSVGELGAARRNTEVVEYIYHHPHYDVIDRSFQGFEEVEVIRYGDERTGDTEKSNVTRNKYYMSSLDPERALSGRLKAKEVYEFTLHGSYADEVHGDNFDQVDPSSALLHSLSWYARGQSRPCNYTGEDPNCKKRSEEVYEVEAVGVGHAPGAYLVRTVESSQRLYGVASEDEKYQCNVVGQVLKHDSYVKETQTFVLEFDEKTNLPKKQQTWENGLLLPFGVEIPQRIIEENRQYKQISKLGIYNLVEIETVQAIGQDGSRLPIKQVLSVFDEEHGWEKSKTETIYSRLAEELPDEVSGAYAGQQAHAVTTYGYDAFGNVERVELGLGVVEEQKYDESGVLAKKMVEATGAVTGLGYDERGRLKTITTPTMVMFTLDYDELGRRKRYYSEQTGYEESYQYKMGVDYHPNLLWTKVRRYQAGQTPEGQSEWIERLVAHDPRGREIASFEHGSFVTEEGDESKAVRVLGMREYNRKGSVVKEWTPFLVGYQELSELFVASFPIGENSLPALEGVSNNNLAEKLTKYNPLGLPVKEELPTGKVMEYAYYPWGEAVLSTVPKEVGVSAVGNYQTCRQVIRRGEEVFGVVDELGAAHRFVRGLDGQIEKIWLAGEKNPRLVKSNSIGQLEMISAPGLGRRFYLYDALNRRTHGFRYDMHGKYQGMLETQYDTASRPIKVFVNGLEEESFYYDAYEEQDLKTLREKAEAIVATPVGQLTKVTRKDPNGLVDYGLLLGYDNQEQITVRDVTLADWTNSLGKGVEQSFVESYGYTLDGMMNYKKDPFGVDTNVGFTRAMRLRSAALTLPWQEGWETIIERVAYNPKGQISHVNYREGVSTTLKYNNATLMLKEIHSLWSEDKALQNLKLTLDGNGNVIEIDDRLQADVWGRLNRSAKYKYNKRNELISAEWLKLSEAFGYDLATPKSKYDYDYTSAGNLKKNGEYSDSELVTESYADVAGQQTGLLPRGQAEQTIEYNGLGQLVNSGKVKGAQFDGRGRLICAQTQDKLVKYGYDGEGLRIYKRVIDRKPDETCVMSISDAQRTKQALYPMQGVIVEPTGNQSFVFVQKERLARVEHAQRKNGKGLWYYYLKDHLGSSDVMIAPDGTPVEQMVYRPYGSELEPEKYSSKWNAQKQAADDLDLLPPERTHHRFTGHYLDDDTGLYYMKARYYDPQLGRFISPDPLFLDQPELCTARITECNLYSYAGNNPLNRWDPSGKIFETLWDIANVVMDVASLAKNVVKGNWSAAAVDAAGLAADVAATLIPGVPGGAGTAIRAARAADKVVDTAKTLKKAEKVSDSLQQSKRLAKGSSAPKAGPGSYTPNRVLPTDKHGVPIPDSPYPHTQLGRSKPKYGSEPQAREWDYGSNGNLQPQRDIDFTDHGFPDAHPHVPHQHKLTPNNPKLAPKGGYTREKGGGRPL